MYRHVRGGGRNEENAGAFWLFCFSSSPSFCGRFASNLHPFRPTSPPVRILPLFLAFLYFDGCMCARGYGCVDATVAAALRRLRPGPPSHLFTPLAALSHRRLRRCCHRRRCCRRRDDRLPLRYRHPLLARLAGSHHCCSLIRPTVARSPNSWRLFLPFDAARWSQPPSSRRRHGLNIQRHPHSLNP